MRCICSSYPVIRVVTPHAAVVTFGSLMYFLGFGVATSTYRLDGCASPMVEGLKAYFFITRGKRKA